MRRDLPSSAVNGPVWLGDYTRAMMIKRILTICAAVAAASAGTSLAYAQQGYPVPPGPVYSASPGSYVPGGYAVDERRRPGAPDFDALDDDDDAPNAQGSTALPPPGPVLSPNDPRYGRPMYSDRGPPMPTGPVLSPDDPRYGRPAGPPPVIYSDRAPYPSDDRAMRPRQAVGVVRAAAGRTAGSRPCAAAAQSAPSGSCVPDQGARRHAGRRYAQHL